MLIIKLLLWVKHWQDSRWMDDQVKTNAFENSLSTEEQSQKNRSLQSNMDLFPQRIIIYQINSSFNINSNLCHCKQN